MKTQDKFSLDPAEDLLYVGSMVVRAANDILGDKGYLRMGQALACHASTIRGRQNRAKTVVEERYYEELFDVISSLGKLLLSQKVWDEFYTIANAVEDVP